MFFMIKRRIDLDFHVNFSDKLNNTSYLYGSIFNKNDETLQYVLYKDDKAIYKLNEKFEIIEQKKIVDNAWVNLIYYKDDKFIFKYQDDTNLYYSNLEGLRISIPLENRMHECLINNDKLFIFNIKNIKSNNYLVYDNSLLKLNETVESSFIINNYQRRNNHIDDKIESVLANEFILNLFKMNDSYILITKKYYAENKSIYVTKLDENYNIIFKNEICSNLKAYEFKLQQFNNNYYVSYLLPRNKVIIKKYDSKLDLVNEESISSYRNDFMIINNELCIIIDDPKRYDKDMKKYKNQELMGNSSLLILD